MLIIYIWVSLITHGHTKSITRFDGSYHRAVAENFGVSKSMPNKYMRPVKRSGDVFHKLIPEHFGMTEHGPEIHLDIDEYGSRVDTHPSVLSLDTGTNPQEHCCHHCSECHHCCEGGCNSCYGCCHPECCHDDCCNYGDCCRRGLYDGNIHQNDGHDRHSGPQLLQHSVTPEARFNRQNCDGEGYCSVADDTEQCYGGLCRNQVAHNTQPYQPFQISEHAAQKPLHNVYEAQAGVAHISPFLPTNYMVAQSEAKDEHQAGFERITNDAHVDHGTGELRDTIGNDVSKDTHETSPNDLPSLTVEHPPQLITFGRSSEGLAFTNGEVSHSHSAAEVVPYSKLDAIAIKRTIFNTGKIFKYSK